MSSTYLPFLAVAIGTMLVPGPDTLVVLRTALTNGARSGVWAAAGTAVGNLVWGTAAVAGVVAVLTASATAFSVLKLAGAAYLVYLGYGALRAAWRGEPVVPAELEQTETGYARAFRRGLLTDLLNVKAGMFWTALTPQFMTGDTSTLTLVAMIATVPVLAMIWLGGYAYLADRARRGLARRAVARAVNGGTGTVFVGLAARLALASRH